MGSILAMQTHVHAENACHTSPYAGLPCQFHWRAALHAERASLPCRPCYMHYKANSAVTRCERILHTEYIAYSWVQYAMYSGQHTRICLCLSLRVCLCVHVCDMHFSFRCGP